MNRLLPGAILVGVAAAPLFGQNLDSTATYEVTFDVTWSAQTHPGAFPSSAHFSPLIGATHSADAQLWELGGIATNGIRQMAETGATVVLRGEIAALQNAGTAFERITGPGAGAPANVSTTLKAHTDHPLVTLVSMIAPSPDWFVGTESLSLLDDGEWAQSITYELFAYDAGTDSGTTFWAANSPTNPREPIRLLHNEVPFVGLPALGTFTFDLVSIDYDCPADFDENGLVNSADIIAYLGDYNLVRNGGTPVHNDPDLAAPFGVINTADLLAFLNVYAGGC